MEKLTIQDPLGDRVELIEANPATHPGRVHLHTVRNLTGDMRCVHLAPVDQELMFQWLAEKLGYRGADQPITLIGSPVEVTEEQAFPETQSIRITVGQGETLREVIWEGVQALPDSEGIERMTAVLTVGALPDDPDGRRSRVIELRRDNLRLQSLANTFALERDAAMQDLDGLRGQRNVLDSRVRDLTVSLDRTDRALKQETEKSSNLESRVRDLVGAVDSSQRHVTGARDARKLAEDAQRELMAKLKGARVALTEIAALVTAHAGPEAEWPQQILTTAFAALEATEYDA